MTTPDSATPQGPPEDSSLRDGEQWRLSQFRIIPQIDKYPSVVAYAQTPLGKLAVLALFGLGLWLLDMSWRVDFLVVIAAITFFPQYRTPLVLLGTLYWTATFTLFDWYIVREVLDRYGVTNIWDGALIRPTAIVAVLLYCAFFYALVCRFEHTLLGRRPLVSLFCAYYAMVLAACYLPLPSTWAAALWIFIIIFGRYIWFLAYSLLDRRAREHDGFIWQLRSYLGFWIGLSTSPAPIPKGAANLRRIEAKTPQALAVSQLKGIKLLYWAMVLMVVETVYSRLIHDEPGYLTSIIDFSYSFSLPTYKVAFYDALAGQYRPWYVSFAAVVSQLFRNVLYIAIWGHIIIACVRMAGYNALRGTYKPLYAKTLAEFWNRYFYYFKELLVEFFFYPTYTRYFKKYPRFRLFFATLMAAGFGNVLFHFIRDVQYVFRMGFLEALVAIHVYMFYGMVLGTAIGISQLRMRKRVGPRPWWSEYITAPAGVILFYCFVLIFDDPDRNLTLKDNFVFVLSLFGVHIR